MTSFDRLNTKYSRCCRDNRSSVVDKCIPFSQKWKYCWLWLTKVGLLPNWMIVSETLNLPSALSIQVVSWDRCRFKVSQYTEVLDRSSSELTRHSKGSSWKELRKDAEEPFRRGKYYTVLLILWTWCDAEYSTKFGYHKSLTSKHVSEISSKFPHGGLICLICATKALPKHPRPTIGGNFVQFLAVQNLMHAGGLFRSEPLVRGNGDIALNNGSMLHAEKSTSLGCGQHIWNQKINSYRNLRTKGVMMEAVDVREGHPQWGTLKR